MHRIDTAGNVDNRFSEGNPQIGQMSTRLSAAWFTDVQEEMATVIEQAGIALVKGQQNQLYLAIVDIIESAVAGLVGGGPAPVPISRQISTAGLLGGGGTLANDLILTVLKASAAEIAAGAIDTKAITPLGLDQSITRVFTGNGYIKLPGGLILQWGTGSAGQSATTILTLPTTFPNACLFAAVEGGPLNTNAVENNPTVVGRGTGNISVYNAYDATIGVNFFALGYRGQAVMSIFYSPSTQSFFDETIHGFRRIRVPDEERLAEIQAEADAADPDDTAGQERRRQRALAATKLIDNPGCRIPADAIEIEAERHESLLAGLLGGKQIVQTDGGLELVDPEVSVEQLLAQIRARRDRELSATDWTQLPDALTAAKRKLWADHRKALRDLPALVEKSVKAGNPVDSIAFPQAPAA